MADSAENSTTSPAHSGVPPRFRKDDQQAVTAQPIYTVLLLSLCCFQLLDLNFWQVLSIEVRRIVSSIRKL